MMNPGTAMNSPREPHVVWMIVKDNHAQASAHIQSCATLDQWQAQMMKIATAKKNGAVIPGGRHAAFQVPHACPQDVEPTTIADSFAPIVVQYQSDFGGEGSDGAISVKYHRAVFGMARFV